MLVRVTCRVTNPGRLAQLVERLLYTQDVGGSSPSLPTTHLAELEHFERLCLELAAASPMPEERAGLEIMARNYRAEIVAHQIQPAQ